MLEEIAEARPAEFKFEAIRHRAAARPFRTSAAGWPAALAIPVLPEEVVFLAFLRIAQHLVGFVDLFEFFLRSGLVLGDVRVELPSKLAKGLFDLRLRRIPADAQHLIVIPEFHCHGFCKNGLPEAAIDASRCLTVFL